MKLYLDSSVLVAAFSPEAFTNRALDILASSPEVVISELTVTVGRVKNPPLPNIVEHQSFSKYEDCLP